MLNGDVSHPKKQVFLCLRHLDFDHGTLNTSNILLDELDRQVLRQQWHEGHVSQGVQGGRL